METGPETGKTSLFLRFAERAARGAGDVLLSHFRKLDGYERKGAIDLVTKADRASEDFLTTLILKEFPEHAILGEESGRLVGNAGSDFVWILDPLDGTTNFAHGLRLFAVSVGLVFQGEPLAGAVFAPALDEMYTGARGLGAYRNGDRIRVSDRAPLQDALLVTGFPYDRVRHMEAIVGTHREALIASRGVLRLGAASLDLAQVAAGHFDGFWEYGLKPWDMAAGTLLVEEAGGRVTGLLEGEPFNVHRPRCVATNGRIHGELLEALRRGGAAAFPG